MAPDALTRNEILSRISNDWPERFKRLLTKAAYELDTKRRGTVAVSDLEEFLESFPQVAEASLEEWAEVQAAILPELYGCDREGKFGTKTIPGTSEKMVLLGRRHRAGFSLWHQDDTSNA